MTSKTSKLSRSRLMSGWEVARLNMKEECIAELEKELDKITKEHSLNWEIGLDEDWGDVWHGVNIALIKIKKLKP